MIKRFLKFIAVILCLFGPAAIVFGVYNMLYGNVATESINRQTVSIIAIGVGLVLVGLGGMLVIKSNSLWLDPVEKILFENIGIKITNKYILDKKAGKKYPKTNVDHIFADGDSKSVVFCDAEDNRLFEIQFDREIQAKQVVKFATDLVKED